MGTNRNAQPADQDPPHPAKRQSGIIRAVGALREQNTQLAAMLGELQDAYGLARAQVQTELDSLRAERDELKQLLEEERVAGAAAADQPDAGLQAEVARLQQLLEEKEAHISQLQGPARENTGRSEGTDIEEYEAELNDFRRQLEADRQALNQEMDQLRVRNQELQDASREAELELSRERAQLARERVQLDRLRDEIRQELERAQRNAESDQRLAPIQRLQEEMVGRHRPADNAAANSQRDGNVLARWRNIRSRLSDQGTGS
jgi:chromosome segregation ATPase